MTAYNTEVVAEFPMDYGWSGLESDVNGLVAQYLAVFSDPPFNDMQPSSFFFMAKWRGPLARWLSHPAQQEARVYMHGFLKDIHDFDTRRQEGMPLLTRLKKTILLTTSKEMKAAVLDLEKSLAVFGASPGGIKWRQ